MIRAPYPCPHHKTCAPLGAGACSPCLTSPLLSPTPNTHMRTRTGTRAHTHKLAPPTPARLAVPVYSATDIEGIRAACRLGREILDAGHRAVRPGVTTDEIDRVVHEASMEAGAYPSPYNYFNFPKSVCTSVNEVRADAARGEARVLTNRSLLSRRVREPGGRGVLKVGITPGTEGVSSCASLL